MITDKTFNSEQNHSLAGATDRMIEVDLDGLKKAEKDIIDAEITDATVISDITDSVNWEDGEYIGDTLVDRVYAGQEYTDGIYKYESLEDGTIIRTPAKTVDAKLTEATVIALLEDAGNWALGVYTGTAIEGTYQGMFYSGTDYYYTATSDNIWVRLFRSAMPYTFLNGLTESTGTAVLGGALTAYTSIEISTGNGFEVHDAAYDNDFYIHEDGITLKHLEGALGFSGTAGNELVAVGTDDIYLEFKTGVISALAIAQGLVISDNRATGSKEGLTYAADYSDDFIDESIITKRYADSLLSSVSSNRIENTLTTSYLEFGTAGGDAFISGNLEVTGDTRMFGLAEQSGNYVFDVNAQGSIYNDGARVFSFDITNNNLFIGDERANDARLTSAWNNIVIGTDAGASISTTQRTILIGCTSGVSVIGGEYGIAIGQNADLVGDDAIAIGGYAKATSASISIGKYAGLYSTGSYNILLGLQAGYDTNFGGSYNIFAGYRTGYSSVGAGNNVFLGRQAGFSNIEGGNSIYIGPYAGYYELGSSKFIISNIINTVQTDEAGGRTTALMYGVMNATTVNQTLALNANVSTPYKLTVGTNLGYTNSEGLLFGDGDSGFYESSDDTIDVHIGGVSQWEYTSFNFSSKLSNGPGLAALTTSGVIPTLLPRRSDTNTGIGSYAADSVSIISGGIEGLRFVEANSHVLQKVEIDVGITASATQTQGQQVILSSFNEISTVATSGDVVTLPTAVIGYKITIINNGANNLQVYPSSSDDLGQGVDTAEWVSTGIVVVYLAISVSVWKKIN